MLGLQLVLCKTMFQRLGLTDAAFIDVRKALESYEEYEAGNLFLL